MSTYSPAHNSNLPAEVLEHLHDQATDCLAFSALVDQGGFGVFLSIFLTSFFLPRPYRTARDIPDKKHSISSLTNHMDSNTEKHTHTHNY
ncbi:hypothetical protein L873DRAFT_1807972 [Choiromyces venosus 120613-1]|uniref:Uncharacterized protein n=1 Tax=Choiromyces venosus 120613-1 TaxID=1336337 RepID=A0A3N4JY46_9PEZI|nr:hypothetical protein L873DRAFT_1807972 [Choiromyces venosus 120613-1]